MCEASCQPTIMRLNASITNEKNTSPSQQRKYVRSATHNSLGRLVVKSRSTRSGRRSACGSDLVVRHGFPRRLAPWMPLFFISRSIRPRPARSPSRLSAFHIRRDP